MRKKGILNEEEYRSLEELALDSQVKINCKSEEEDKTPLMLLCSSSNDKTEDETDQQLIITSSGTSAAADQGRHNSHSIFKCVDILLRRKDIDVNVKDKEGSNALILLCRDYQGDDLVEVMRLLIRRETRNDDEHDRIKERSTALLNLCQFYEGPSLKGAIRILIDEDNGVLEAKNNNGDSVLSLLLGRRNDKNSRIDLVEIVRFVMERGLQWNRSKLIDEIVNGRNCDTGRNVLHVLCNVYNDKFVELVCLLQDLGGIDLEEVDGDEGQNALHFLLSSVVYNRVDHLMKLVECLVNDFGIDPKAKGKNNKDAFDILFDCCSHREDLIDLFRLLVGRSVYPNPYDNQGNKALLPLCSSADRIRDYYKRFAPQLIKSRKIDVNAVNYNYEFPLNDRSLRLIDKLCESVKGKRGLFHMIQCLWLEFMRSKKITNVKKDNEKRIVSYSGLSPIIRNEKTHDDFLKLINRLFDGCREEKFEANDIISSLSQEFKFEENLICLMHNVSLANSNDSKSFSFDCREGTVLHMLCTNCQDDDLIKLIGDLIVKENNFNINSLDEDGAPALHRLCQHHTGRNLKDIAQLLIDNGSDAQIQAENSHMKTLFDRLAQNKSANPLRDVFQFFIRNGVDVSKTNFFGRDALHYVCKNYKGDDIKDIFELLVENGIDIKTKKNWDKQEILYLLCKNYHGPHLKEIIELLIENGIDVNYKEKYENCNPLHILCQYCKSDGNLLLEIVNLFIENGIDLTATDIWKCNALHILCQNYKGDGNLLLEIMHLFIKNGIDLIATDNQQHNVLHLLCENYKGEKLLQIASEILSASDFEISATCGDIVDSTNKDDSRAQHCDSTALHLLCEHGNKNTLTVELIQLFISKMKNKKEEVNKLDSNGNNVLHLLCSRKFDTNEDVSGDVLLKIVTLLIESGIDINQQNKDKDNALHLLCECYHGPHLKETIELLIKNRIDIKARNKKRSSYAHQNALLILCQEYKGDGNRLLEIVNILIEANIEFANYPHRDNALSYLIRSSYHITDNLFGVIKQLIEKGLHFNPCCSDADAIAGLFGYYQGNDMKEIIDLLFERKSVDPDATNSCGANILHLLCDRGKKTTLTVDMVQFLIDKMRNETTNNFAAVDWNGDNALHYLCNRTHFKTQEDERNISGDVMIEITTLLIKNGIDVNQVNRYESNSLHYLCVNACYHQYFFNLIKLLISNEIDVRKTDRKGKSAIDLLCKHFLSRKNPIDRSKVAANQQQMLFPIVRYLVDEIENGVVIETESYENRPNPLYLLLENYTGADMLDIVTYFVVDKKIAFKREEALAILRRRQYNVTNKNKIERVLLRAYH